MAEIRAHIIVSGRVQGVGFRFFVMKIARHLKLKGWVKNLYSGKVEILVEGEEGMVEELIKTLPVGNRMADVTDLNVKKDNPRNEFTGFDVAY